MKYQQCLIFFLAESSLFVFIRVIIFDTKGGEVHFFVFYNNPVGR